MALGIVCYFDFESAVSTKNDEFKAVLAFDEGERNPSLGCVGSMGSWDTCHVGTPDKQSPTSNARPCAPRCSAPVPPQHRLGHKVLLRRRRALRADPCSERFLSNEGGKW